VCSVGAIRGEQMQPRVYRLAPLPMLPYIVSVDHLELRRIQHARYFGCSIQQSTPLLSVGVSLETENLHGAPSALRASRATIK
jgi:hypothetical protein